MQPAPSTSAIPPPPELLPRYLHRMPGRDPYRDQLHEDHLVQALLLFHLPDHRPRAARPRRGWRARRRLRASTNGDGVPGGEWSALAGSVAIALGYFVVARTQLNAFDLTVGWKESAKLVIISGALFAPFLAAGIIIATIFTARPERIHRLYATDLVGAGLGCALAVPLISLIGPPGAVVLAGLLYALADCTARPVGRFDSWGGARSPSWRFWLDYTAGCPTRSRPHQDARIRRWPHLRTEGLLRLEHGVPRRRHRELALPRLLVSHPPRRPSRLRAARLQGRPLDAHPFRRRPAVLPLPGREARA